MLWRILAGMYVEGALWHDAQAGVSMMVVIKIFMALSCYSSFLSVQ